MNFYNQENFIRNEDFQHIFSGPVKHLHYFHGKKKKIRSSDQKVRLPPEPSPITAGAAAGLGEEARLPEEAVWQELVPWFEQIPAGEPVRLRNSRSMEGSRGLRRLTGQKAEPPWGVKFTLFGSGQEETMACFSWRGELRNRKETAVRLN